MSRYIDADSMKRDLLTVDQRYETMISWCITVLDAQPTVDVTEVIRCKDCKYFDTINEPYNETFCRLCFMNKSKKGYCDKAERRTDEQNI